MYAWDFLDKIVSGKSAVVPIEWNQDQSKDAAENTFTLVLPPPTSTPFLWTIPI
jgi:hypothetical protein